MRHMAEETIHVFQSTKPYRLRRIAEIITPGIWWFQSTKPYRLRRWKLFPVPRPHSFQSTKPYRLRPAADNKPDARLDNFNPRSRIGFDYFLPPNKNSLLPFQSTKPYRLRLSRRNRMTSLDRFHSTKPYRLRQQKYPKNNLITQT